MLELILIGGITFLTGTALSYLLCSKGLKERDLLLFENSELKNRTLQCEIYQKDLGETRQELAIVKAGFEEKERGFLEKLVLLEQAKEQLVQQFAQLSQSALEQNNRLFLDLAQQRLEVQQEQVKAELGRTQKQVLDTFETLKVTIDKLEDQSRAIELKRVEAYTSMGEQVKGLMETQINLQRETRNLTTALKMPSQRGRWGEIQLKRVVEMAGMLEYCDFREQVSVNIEDGRLRPDLVIQLPNAKQIVIDSKVALDAYLDVVQTDEESVRKKRLVDHAQHVRNHIKQLSAKSYWQQFDSTPEFVVMFLPGEPIFSAALEQDPQLIEFGSENRVLIATPITLIALLRAVSYGWRQERIAENAHQISIMARDLYSRINTFTEHFVKVGSQLDRSVKSYNEAVGSMERMVIPQIRKLKDQGVHVSQELPILEPIERMSREMQV